MLSQLSLQQLMYFPAPTESLMTGETYECTGLFHSPFSLALILSLYSKVSQQLGHFQPRHSQPAAEMLVINS